MDCRTSLFGFVYLLLSCSITANDDSLLRLKIVVNELDPRRNVFSVSIRDEYFGPGKQVEIYRLPVVDFWITQKIPVDNVSTAPDARKQVELIPQVRSISGSFSPQVFGKRNIRSEPGSHYFIYQPGEYHLLVKEQIQLPRDLVEGMPDSAKRTRLLKHPDESGKYCTDDMATSPTVTFTVAPWTEEWFNPEPEPDDLLQIKLTSDAKYPHKLVIDEVIEPRSAFRSAITSDVREWEIPGGPPPFNEGQRLLGMRGEVNTDKLLRLEGTDDYSRLLTDSWTVCLIYHNGKLLEHPNVCRCPMPKRLN